MPSRRCCQGPYGTWRGVAAGDGFAGARPDGRGLSGAVTTAAPSVIEWSVFDDALRLHQTDEVAGSMTLYEQILGVREDSALAQNNLGVVRMHQD